jgi:hypothetical protein
MWNRHFISLKATFYSFTQGPHHRSLALLRFCSLLSPTTLKDDPNAVMSPSVLLTSSSRLSKDKPTHRTWWTSLEGSREDTMSGNESYVLFDSHTVPWWLILPYLLDLVCLWLFLSCCSYVIEHPIRRHNWGSRHWLAVLCHWQRYYACRYHVHTLSDVVEVVVMGPSHVLTPSCSWPWSWP